MAETSLAIGRGRRMLEDKSLVQHIWHHAKLARKSQVCILRFGECLHGSYRSEQSITLESGSKTLSKKRLEL